jgi:hypothetical protein
VSIADVKQRDHPSIVPQLTANVNPADDRQRAHGRISFSSNPPGTDALE